MATPYVPKDQGLRFQKKGDASYAKTSAAKDAAAAGALLSRRNALFQDYARAHQKPAWSPSTSAAFRFLIIIRVSSAMYSVIKDCDESFGYWEPLHLLVFPRGKHHANVPFQTWEYSPPFAIRSWAFIAQFLPLAKTLAFFGVGKRQIFFAVRMLLAFVSSFVDARFYKAVADVFSARVGRYCLVALASSAGVYEASTAFLPSTFVLHATTLAFSSSLYPARLPSTDSSVLSSTSQRPFRPERLIVATLSFAAGALLGWPFAILLALPFVLEQLFFRADDIVAKGKSSHWTVARWSTAISAAVLSAFFALPILAVDTLAYGKLSFVPLNTVLYNLFSQGRGAGPELYGTEPFTFYFSNLFLNFNIFFLLALLSLPLLLVSARLDPRRFQRPAPEAKKGHASTANPSSLFSLALLRIAPFYMWFIVLCVQAHKEERFMYPAYTLLCMNAAVSLHIIRTLAEVIFVKVTNSPYRASKSSLFTSITSSVLVVGVLLGVLRSVGQLNNYHGPFDVLFHFEGYELPRVIADKFPESLNPAVKQRIARGLSPVATEQEKDYNDRGYGAENKGVSVDLTIDLTPLTTLDKPIRLCYGKEWHRFPTHFLVPAGVEVEWIKSEFSGILPKHFDVDSTSTIQSSDVVSSNLDTTLGWAWPWSTITRRVQPGFNDLNKEEMDRYVDISTCDYLVDLDLPHRGLVSKESQYEPRYAIKTEEWDRVFCGAFLDAEYSRPAADPRDSIVKKIGQKAMGAMHRAFWLPKAWPGNTNMYGDYCLLRNRDSRFSPATSTARA
ncbi:related to ALG9 - mannosyltransferase [Melanopsichium pennsylvanicum]|uniref:Mannosyltransferase n=2 Tax=Melanopsichium pennsylvanicum TaxID=63383 RepID=A0AAJ5C898_9BASI|nr:related to ALG9-mannosyltransferase [Melanopsichium pennsylvanicum 4]SNX87780.1 related to ALG9 - mannosyltransferase [Melanopsichium pennsylvanicum]